ncbi:MAG TPA: UpxY family transcription antiterminator [Bryobacteraceae bacterium]|nr:UpxY family transcription antiterminator [Bryobacteraceae bacterium]
MSVWHAIQVRPQHEKAVDRHLCYLGRESFLPLFRTRRRWSDRIKELEMPLFPGYVLCRFEAHEKGAVLSVPGVRSIVSFGSELAVIPDAEVDSIRALLRAGVPIRPWPYLEVGNRVRIESGPLQGVQGVLLKFKNEWQVVVSVEILRRSVMAEVELTAVFPCNMHPAPAWNSYLQV